MKLFVIAFIAFLSSFAVAQTSTVTIPSSAKSENSQGENTLKVNEVIGNKKFADDKEITDAKMKADSGSLSRYSLSFNLSYYGPTVGDLSAKDQPNPDGSVGTYETSLGGSLGARYRLSSSETISAGTGLKAIYPLHGMQRFDTNNPYLSYSKVHRIGGVQMRQSPGISAITVPNYTRIGEYGSLNYDLSTVYNIAATRFAVGLDSSFGYYLYNREYRKSDGRASRYGLSFFPMVKYNFTDKFSMNTSLNVSFWNPRSREDQWAMLNRTVSQRLGMGYAFTRDIYFSPYLNFYPDKLSTDRTTVNVSTVFSLL